ncbi:MAG: Flp pilus assembly complex ATPase component TadA, partial [Alphaproteobacteria bacterium]|nr:Flp pilus assembly complex ATPase component TadA [Alphaproteobacteria bacterium]
MVTVTDTRFSDIYITTENKKAYIPDRRTLNALMEFEPEDLDVFFEALENGYDGNNPSYSITYEGILYRVEKSEGIAGSQYCVRKMPSQVPSINALGYPPELVKYLLALRRSSGLILCAGPTGSGKTTTVSALLREFLIKEGGFAYTIE